MQDQLKTIDSFSECNPWHKLKFDAVLTSASCRSMMAQSFASSDKPGLRLYVSKVLFVSLVFEALLRLCSLD